MNQAGDRAAVARVVSGGQTGVDRAALEAAILLGIPHGGWCPKGRLAEDGWISHRYQLRETESADYPVRTEQNVLDSDATLILYRDRLIGGTELTRRLAQKHGKPVLVVDLQRPLPVGEIHRWLQAQAVQVLNVAGPRESSAPGIRRQAEEFLCQVLSAASQIPAETTQPETMQQNATNMIRVGVTGATGYTACELIKMLLRHPHVEITTLTTRQEGRPAVASVHPSLHGRLDLVLEDLAPEAIAERCDCVFSCLPHAASAAVVRLLADAGKRVVDFSADYRLHDAETYAAWYGGPHVDPDRLGVVPYGLPELFSKQLAGAQLVANPGCYPTSAILALAPLLQRRLIRPDGIILDSKSGVSGAGRTPKLGTLYPECNESLSAYNIGRHRHTPEIDQFLSLAAGEPVEVIFTPHLVPMDRGILTTAYALPTGELSDAAVTAALREFYAGQPFVQVLDDLPGTKQVSGTNFCHLAARCVRGRVLVVSCIDNLVKGASGAAVQNFNWMYGFPETTALLP